MSMKLLPASVNSAGTSEIGKVSTDVSAGLVPLAQRAITMRTGQTSLIPSADAFRWSSSTPRGGPNRIDAIPLEDSQRDATAGSGWEYLSGWAWSQPVERTAVAHYLFYAGVGAGWSGRHIDLYA